MEKSYTYHIAGALRSGEALLFKEIAERVLAASGREVAVSAIGKALRKIGDPERNDLGHFVELAQKEGGYVYRLVAPARALSADQLYGLTLKRGGGTGIRWRRRCPIFRI